MLYLLIAALVVGVVCCVLLIVLLIRQKGLDPARLTDAVADEVTQREAIALGTVKADRRHNTIHIRNGLFHNQIFADDEDFDFVLEYIVAHCPKATTRHF